MKWIDQVIRDIAELGDRNSPDGQPEMMLVTAEELRAIVLRHAPASVTLNGYQLLEVFEFCAPDGEDDADQMETDMAIEYCGEGFAGPGYYAWCADYPEEGCIHLPATPVMQGNG